jgi:hypothetical protein
LINIKNTLLRNVLYAAALGLGCSRPSTTAAHALPVSVDARLKARVFGASIQPITIEVRANRQTHGELRRSAMRPRQRVREEGGRPGTLVRLSAPDDFREYVQQNLSCGLSGSRERGRRVPGCKPEPLTPVTRPRSPGDTTPIAWKAPAADPPLEDPPRPRLIDVCKLTKKSVIRGACSNLVRCCP